MCGVDASLLLTFLEALSQKEVLIPEILNLLVKYFITKIQLTYILNNNVQSIFYSFFMSCSY